MPRAHKASETDGTEDKAASPASTDAPAGAGQAGGTPSGATGPVKRTHAASGTTARKAPAKAASGAAKASGPAAKVTGDHAKKAAPAKAGVATAGTSGAAARADRVPEEPEFDGAFLAEQRQLLIQERAGYVRQAEELKAEADSLALEHEPGDVQFDEEGGEGGTSNVDRELDLVLSAQARSAILEIDRALVKLDAGSYGRCEQCGRPIPQARLQALPYASLCVACKSGGLSRR
jgi:DnaK suppressor protein